MAGFVQDAQNKLTSTFGLVKSSLQSYVSSLGVYEKYAWLAAGVGFLLIILAIMLW